MCCEIGTCGKIGVISLNVLLIELLKNDDVVISIVDLTVLGTMYPNSLTQVQPLI